MKKVISIILIAVMLCTVLVGCSKKKPEETGGGGGVGLVVDPNQGDEQDRGTQEKWPNVACPGWGEIILPPDTTEIAVDFYNPTENAGYYYLTYELRLLNDSAQGYEVLYKSGLIEPGKHIYKVTLSRGLPLGEYQAVMHVQPYKMNSAKTPTNNMNSNLKLTVVNLDA